MSGKKYDVTALGELLIDFTENSVSEQGNLLLEANPGGAPCNVLAMLQKFNKKTAFIGKVGNDKFGNELKKVVQSIGVNIDGVVVDEKVNTTLAFIHNNKDGDRSFSFYRNPGADMMLKKDDININIIKNSKIFHFGTLSFTHEQVAEASKYAINCAKKNGALISFDPNIREHLWDDLNYAKEAMEYGMQNCDILKIADNELQFITGEIDFDKAALHLQDKFKIPLICVTLGKKGSKAYYDGKIITAKPFLRDDTIETTGAGDTFMGCILNTILNKGIKLTENDIKNMLTFANAGASIITTKRGALKVMPEIEEIKLLIQNNK